MDNRDTRAARRFHDATKYTLVGAGEGDEDILMGTPPDLGPAIGEQDPTIEPYPYKVYTTLDPWYLPREFPPSAIPALDALATTGDLPLDRAVPSLDTIARLCLLSNGILKRGSHRTGRVIEYRVAGGTGARYHLELYLVCGDLPGIDAGVYHYAAHDHSLRRLRAGDHRAEIHQATGDEPSIARAPAIIVATSTFWRNAWRYQARAYRHVYWDLGTVLANFLAVAASSELPARGSHGVRGRRHQPAAGRRRRAGGCRLFGGPWQRPRLCSRGPAGRAARPADAPDLIPRDHLPRDHQDARRLVARHGGGGGRVAQSSLESLIPRSGC